MKKKLLSLLAPCLLAASCSPSTTIYYPQVPLDLVYCGTCENYLQTDRPHSDPGVYDKTKNLFAVAQKYETVVGESRLVTYMEWRRICEYGWDIEPDNSHTFLYIHDVEKTFALKNNEWVSEGEAGVSIFSNFEDLYLNRSSSDSFRYFMTNTGVLYGRHLRDSDIIERNDDYIRYMCKDEESFTISNNEYNVVLAYYFSYNGSSGSSLETQFATFEVGSTSVPHLTPNGETTGAKTGTVPYLDTITAAKLND